MRILVTGASGFIGSNLIEHLNNLGIRPLVLHSDLGERWRNLAGLRFIEVYDPKDYLIDIVIHLRAHVDTREAMNTKLWQDNVEFTKSLVSQGARMIYASSAAVYGAEESNFAERIDGLKPLNAYGYTKWRLDQMLETKAIGLRFFNVYGPREWHKGDMASVIHKGLTGQTPLVAGEWKLFESERPDVANGNQARDFVHVSDVCRVIEHFLRAGELGVYNVGSGVASTFNELTNLIRPYPKVYVPLPDTLKGQYQYRTCANLTKLRASGYTAPFLSLKEGIELTRQVLCSK